MLQIKIFHYKVPNPDPCAWCVRTSLNLAGASLSLTSYLFSIISPQLRTWAFKSDHTVCMPLLLLIKCKTLGKLLDPFVLKNLSFLICELEILIYTLQNFVKIDL